MVKHLIAFLSNTLMTIFLVVFEVFLPRELGAADKTFFISATSVSRSPLELCALSFQYYKDTLQDILIETNYNWGQYKIF